MQIAQWIFGILFLVFGTYMSAMNWACFVNNVIPSRRFASVVPLVGGISGSIGVICLPISGVWKYFWIPFIVDYGSIPLILLTATFLAYHRLRD